MSPAARRLLLAGAARRRRFSTDVAPRQAAWDAVVIGGGHNGLVAAAYIARAGRSVVVLERRGVLGGAAVSESDLVPGFRFSRCSYLLSLLRPAIIRELELERHGLKLLPRNPSSFTPFLDDRYEEKLEKFCKLMDFVIDSTPPELRQEFHASMIDRMKDRVDKSAFWGQLLRHVMQQGQKNMVEFFDLLLSPASKILNYWFESDVLKATLATDAVIGSMVIGWCAHSRFWICSPAPCHGGDWWPTWCLGHVINLFVQYTPYKLSEGSWQDSNVREAFAKRCFSLIDEYVPGFSSSVVGYDILTPPDLEREFGLTVRLSQEATFPWCNGLGFSFPHEACQGMVGLQNPCEGSVPLRERRTPRWRGDGRARTQRRCLCLRGLEDEIDVVLA